MNSKLVSIFFFLYLTNVLCSNAQIASVFKNIKFGDSTSTVQKELVKISDSLKTIDFSNPQFPLSKNSEIHVLAYGIKIKTKILDRAVFTFADNRLCYIEANGNTLNFFGINDRKNLQSFMNYNVHLSDLLFSDSKNDKVWVLTPEATHPNLFTWNNPLLIDTNSKMEYSQSAKIPKFIKMGSPLKAQQKKIERHSQIIQIDSLDGSDPNAQIQINAYGIEYAGFPRKFEVRFGNEKLNMIWVLTAKGEENRLRQKLIKAYGKAVFINQKWEFFNNWTVALRKDKPEVLFLTEALGKQYKESLKK